MFAPHVQVLAARFGPVLPCPPYLYGVVVGLGPDFVRSGFSGGNMLSVHGQLEYCLGTTVVPDAAAMREWIDYPLQAIVRGQDPMGGWSPSRSLVVRWGSARQEFYFKAGDDDECDLVHWPLAMSQDFDLDAAIATMEELEDVWVSGVIANLIEGEQKLPASVFREVSALLMEFLNTERRMMKAMIASTRLEHGRFMAYFRQEQRQGSLPSAILIPESLIIAQVYDEFGQDVNVLPTSSSIDRVVNDNHVAQENDLT